jgi:hypothetical protein
MAEPLVKPETARKLHGTGALHPKAGSVAP